MVDTRPPRPAPYPVGAKVKYVGRHEVYAEVDGLPVEVQVPGMVAEVIRTESGWQGTGRLIDTDEDGYEYYDETHDGYSVIEMVPGHGRCIDPDSKDWVLVEGSRA